MSALPIVTQPHASIETTGTKGCYKLCSSASVQPLLKGAARPEGQYGNRLLRDHRARGFHLEDLDGRVNIFGWLVEDEFGLGNVRID